MATCRICLGAAAGSLDYHPECLQSLFGTETLPRLDIELSKLMGLAAEMAGKLSILICTRLPIPSDRALALPICGKKSNLKRQVWLDFAEYSQIAERDAVRTLDEQIDALGPSLHRIEASFLTDELKVQYQEIVRQNTELLR